MTCYLLKYHVNLTMKNQICGCCLKLCLYHHHNIRVFCPRAGISLQMQEPRLQFCPKEGLLLQAQESRLQFCQRQVFHCKLRNQGCNFIRDWIGAVASCCFPYPTLSLASEQILKDLKRSKGNQLGGEESDFANWALRTAPKFTIGVKYQFHQGFWLDQRSGNPNHPSLPFIT